MCKISNRESDGLTYSSIRFPVGVIFHLRMHLYRPLILGLVLVVSQLLGFSQAGSDSNVESSVLNYLIKPSDLLEIQIFQEPDLNKQVRVEADGTIVLPLVNRVAVGELSINEAQKRIEELYNQDFLVNPQVNLLVLEYHVRKVDILGQVNAPGPIEIPHDKVLTLVEAISRAGSFTRLAKRNAVQVTRIEKDGKKTVIELNADKMMSESNSADYVLRDGDTVFVPERFL